MAKKMILTTSMIRSFKACPRKFELEYIEQLKPRQEAEALTIGSNYHRCLEHILKGEEYTPAEGIVGPMARAFERFIPFKDWHVTGVEVPFEFRIGRYDYFRGKMDGITADHYLIEHKTTGGTPDERYLEHLALDDQVSFYLAAQTHCTYHLWNKVHYTVCQKPKLKLNKNETEEHFAQRLEEWFTEEKVRDFTVVRTATQIDLATEELKYMFKTIRSTKKFYRNPSHCSIIGCPYQSICLDSSPECLSGFESKTSQNEELEGAF